MFYDDWDASDTMNKLLSTIDALQFNEFEKVTFTSISSDGMITEQQREGDIVRVRTSSGLRPALRSRNVTKVKAGRVLTVEVTIAPVDGSPDIVTTMKMRIPSSARGTKDVTARGGHDQEWFWPHGVDSFGELIRSLNGGKHRNDLILSGFAVSEMTVLDWMATNRLSFAVQAV